MPVEDASFLHKNELFGHIEHSLIESKAQNVVFCLLPGFINGLISVPLLLTSSINLFYFGVGMRDAATGLTNPMFFIYVVMFWVGISLWCSKYPMYEDVLQMKEKIYTKKTNKFTKVILFVPTAIVYAGSFLEKYGINVFFACGATATLVYLFPYAFI